MSELLGSPWLVIPVICACVGVIVYVQYEKVADFFTHRTQRQKEEIARLMDLMFVDVNEKRLQLTLLALSYGLAILFFLLLWPNIILGLIFALLVFIAGTTFPLILVKNAWESRCDRLVDQMIDGMTIMGNGIKSGLSVGQSMERVVENMKGPIAQEFGLVLSKTRLGMPLEEALLELGARIPRPDVQMFVTAVNILKETGGNLAETFSTIVLTVRERQKVEKKIQAMTAQGVWQGIIISTVPFLILLLLFILDPTFVMPLFTTAAGLVMLAGILFLVVLGGIFIRKIVTIKV